LREKAETCDREADALEASRHDLLPRAFLGDEKIDKQLANIDPKVQALRRRASDARAAAALLDPAIAELAKKAARAARPRNDVEHRRKDDAHTAAGTKLRAGLGPLFDVIDAYVATGAAVNSSHRAVYGEPEPRESYEPAAFRALRFLNIALHRK